MTFSYFFHGHDYSTSINLKTVQHTAIEYRCHWKWYHSKAWVRFPIHLSW